MPNNFTEINTTASIIAFIAGVWGALLNFIKRDTGDHSLTRKVVTFVFDMIANVGITMLIYIGCIGYGFNDLLSVAVAGFLGHQGVRSFYIMEMILVEKLGAKQTFNEIKDDL